MWRPFSHPMKFLHSTLATAWLATALYMTCLDSGPRKVRWDTVQYNSFSCSLYAKWRCLKINEILYIQLDKFLVCVCTLTHKQVKPRPYRSHPRGSAGSVFEFSPSTSELLQPLVPPEERERDAVKECVVEGDFEEALREISREISSEFSCAHATDNAISPGKTIGSVSDLSTLHCGIPHNVLRL